ncbi:MAG: hypothetical protein HKN22_02980 [Bacteroidia bacterium]|nr:hypothetical protein [Bacteroidia bacterium]
MLKDIPDKKVEDIAIAVVPGDTSSTAGWKVFLINLKDVELEGVLVSSRGYGTHKGKEVETTMFRHSLDVVEANSFKLIEPIDDHVFGLTNEYWVSFWVNKEMFDKKYLFLPESIKEEHMTEIPLLSQKGVMIK